ncbi:MAG: hypothetical protein GM45_5810 [actinobacterium acAMD-5]|jgi:penicillin-binding protein 2|nr:MAG: hypothetical protein GM45_5810 [actinobacterium acAMD-5]
MNDQVFARIRVLKWFTTALLLTLIARLFFIQVVNNEDYQSQAANNRIREVATPAVRGLIVDQAGRALVANRTSLVITIDRSQLLDLPQDGIEVLNRLSNLLKTSVSDIQNRITPCGAEGSAPAPICWNGTGLQPIPIARDVDVQIALNIMENATVFPSVNAEVVAERLYPAPFGTNAAHLLGYLGPISAEEIEELAGNNLYRSNSIVGRAGLEKQYDAQLRGIDGSKKLAVDRAGNVVGEIGVTPSESGNYLVTHIDAKLQAVVEKELDNAINRGRAAGFKSDAGAAIVMDNSNGAILAMASYPNYDPNIWLDGLTNKEYKSLISEASAVPLLYRPLQGLYAPASTFKVVTAAAAVQTGSNLKALYECTPEATISGRVFRNYESRAYGPISIAKALQVSCNTVFYRLGNKMWELSGKGAMTTGRDPIDQMARSFGYSRLTGIDLPSEYAGRIGGRAWKRENWERNKDIWCKRAKTGYPETAKQDPAWAETLRLYAVENCAEGFVFRAGDAVNISIGQGDTVVTPLQVAVAYSAIANGGKVLEPHIAKAILDPSGKVIKQITPKVVSKLSASKQTLNYLRSALAETTVSGTAAWVFPGFPLDQIPIAAKTGTGQVSNKDSTSWLATFAPANNPRYTVVMMVSQGGTGSGTSGPSVRKIYEAIFGVTGNTVSPANSVFVGGAPSAALPKVDTNGSPILLEGATTGVQK